MAMTMLLVTMLNVAASSIETKSASTLVNERMKELGGSMDLHQALEAIQYNNEIPEAIKHLLKRKQQKNAGEKMSLLQGKQTPDADTLRKLDEARVILNKMYIGNQEELDVVIWDCRTYLNAQIKLMDENTRLRTMMGAAMARARAMQLEASAGIKEAKAELYNLNAALFDHEHGCSETLGALREQEAVLANDYEVGMMIQNATERTCAAQQSVSMIACKTTTKKGGAVADDSEELTYDFGPDYKDINTKFTTPLAKQAMQRMMKLALDKEEASPHFGLLQIDRHEMRKRRMAGELNKDKKAPSPAPKTVEIAPVPAPAPDLAISDEHAEHASLPDRPKCSTDDANCPLLFDQIAQMVGEILDALQKVRKEIAETEAHCNAVTADYEGQIAEWEEILDQDQVKLAQAIETENTNAESLRQKVIEYNALNDEFVAKKTACDAKKTEITNTLCGIKIVRLEVYHNEGVYDIIIQDCEVGDWVDNDCDVTCGGGEQSVTREILQEAGPPENPGAECPPVVQKQACNTEGCPVNCAMNDWSEWTACSKDCGSGVKQKARSVSIEAENGGEACEATDMAQVCNMDACDADCVLAEWAPWEKCSKSCNGGIEIRRKYILEEARGMGVCAHEDSPDRFEERPCNMDPCPPNLVCNSKADIVLVLDGSGSVRTKGFAATKLFARKLVERLEINENATKVGLIRFSKKVDVLEQMTFDKDAVLNQIDTMSFPRRTTSTSIAMSMALDVLKAGGRKEVAKSNTIIFLVTDGRPNNAEASNKMAETVRAAGRLVVVPVGTGMGAAGLEQMMSWATFPPEENVLQAEDYKTLPTKVSAFIADICQDLTCRETTEEADMSDYIGCQTQTVEGLGCQYWEEVEDSPYKPNKKGAYPKEAVEGGILGGHNYCRNPDKKPGGIWCYTSSVETPWDYCEPRPANATGWGRGLGHGA